MDELRAHVLLLHEFRSISLMVFTETWLTKNHTDELVEIDGSKVFCEDRTVDSMKHGGGGLMVYVNEDYCYPNNTIIKSHTCTPNAEILTVNIRPFYIPQEFSHVILMAVYAPNKNVAKEAAEEIHEAVHSIASASPDVFVMITGDFNHCGVKRQMQH